VDIIAISAVVFIGLAPLAFIMKRPPKNAKPVAAH
jgi:hypothetical protein